MISICKNVIKIIIVCNNGSFYFKINFENAILTYYENYMLHKLKWHAIWVIRKILITKKE